MKKIIFPVFAFLIAYTGMGQENRFIIGGGWTTANIEDANSSANGWRINGTYEFVPWHSKFSHGFSFGYIGLTTDAAGTSGNVTYKVGTIPFYYVPRFSFGKEKLNGFIKGALGAQVSSFKRTGGLGGSIDDNDFGFVGGGGVGANIFLNEKLFITGEYELLWLENSFYRDGLTNNILIGLGFRFK